MDSKGLAYSGEEDKFGNFNRVGELLKLDRKKVLNVYFHKHIDAIDSYIREEYHDTEPIQGRIFDAINYLLLLSGMIKEDDNEKV